MIRVLVVDDDTLAREVLTREIGLNPEFQVSGFAKNGREALTMIQKLKPDVVFLDIEMPEKDGLEVASELTQAEHLPLIVFQTAFHQYAIEAFDANAVDYILKPVDGDRVRKTLLRIRERLRESSSSKDRMVRLRDDLAQRGLVKKLAAHRRGSKDRILLEPQEVFYFCVHLSDLMARVRDGEWIVNSTMRDLLDILDPASFLQTHKSYIVNVNQVAKVAPMFSGNFEIGFKESAIPKIPLSRRFAAALKARLGNW